MTDEAFDIVLDEPTLEGADKDAAKIIEPEDGIEELKAKLADEKKRADDEAAGRRLAEADALRASREAAQAKGEKQDGDIQVVESAITTLNAEQDRLTKDLEDAWAAGAMGDAAKIQRTISGNEAKLLTLSNGLESLKAAPKPKDVAADPVETLAAQLTPRSASWVKAHPEYARDARLYQRMLAAHNLAVTDGLVPESDDYFAAIEGILGLRAATADAEPDETALSAAAAPAQRRSAPPAAPVGRGGGANRPGMTLSAAEREIAEMNGLTPEEYARNKVALQKEGRLH